MTQAPPSPTTVADQQSHFRTDHLRHDLRGRSVRGGAVTVASGAAAFVISMGSTAILARLLSPADFGLISMVAVIVGFVILFKDMGLSMATVQQANITHQQISTLFWINVAISAGVMGLTMLIAPLIAWFYDQPILLWIAMANAPGQLLSGLMIQHQALLKRQMRFTALAGCGLAGQIGAVVVAISMAANGFGVWSLVAMPLANNAVTLACTWLTCRWRPGLPVRGSGVRTMLRFGGFLTATNIVNYLVRNLDNLLIGKICGALPLGYYAKAYGLLMMPIRQINVPISTIAIPALARLQNSPEPYRRYYQKALGVICLVGMPVVAFASVAASPIILVVLGEQWTDAVPIFLALMPAAWVGTFNVATGWVYMSLGTTDREFGISLVTSVLACIAMGVGVLWGAMGVALALSGVFVLTRLPQVWYCYRGTPLRLRDLAGVLWRPTVASFAAAAPIYFLNRVWNAPAGAVLAGDALLYAVCYPAVWAVLPGGRAILLDTVALFRELRPARRSAA